MKTTRNAEDVRWYWFRCPECGETWGSQQQEPDREWCPCNSADFPELIDGKVSE